MGNVALLVTGSNSAVVLLAARVLRNYPVIVQSVERYLAVDVRHVPMQPGASDFIVEAIDSSMPSTATQSVASLNEQRLLSCSESATMTNDTVVARTLGGEVAGSN